MSRLLALSVILIFAGFVMLACAEAADFSYIDPCPDSSAGSAVPVPYPNTTSSSSHATAEPVKIEGKEVEIKDVFESSESTDEEGTDESYMQFMLDIKKYKQQSIIQVNRNVIYEKILQTELKS